MRVPVGMRTVVVSGGASWAKDPPRPSRLAAPANDTDARKSRRLWNLCMTLPRVELSHSATEFRRSVCIRSLERKSDMAGYRIGECQSAGNSSALGQQILSALPPLASDNPTTRDFECQQATSDWHFVSRGRQWRSDAEGVLRSE